MHDDMQAMRLLQMDKCVKDGQIPCRWVPDMGYGYGYPQFNYYSPLPYYVMEGFYLKGLGYLDSVKAGFVVSVVISAFGMYLLGNSLWGKTGGMVSAFFFTFLPYRAVNMYVRGAVGEFWALSFFPFVFWSAREVVRGNKKGILWLSLSLAALFMSHNISTLIFTPFLFIWIAFLLISEKNIIKEKYKNILKNLTIGFVWGFCLSGFFLLPAWFEKKFVHTETLLQGYFNYLAHFTGLKQLLFSNYFGYGGSELGPYDDMSFAVGILHWTLPLVIFLVFLMLKRKKEALMTLFFIIAGWVFLFMTHSRSVFLWEKIPLIEYLQFPWRYLTVVGFTFSVAVGGVGRLLNKKSAKIYSVIVLYLVLIFFNVSFFKPSEWIEIDDSGKFSGDIWEKQLTISIFDYLPIWAKAPPSQKAPDKPYFVKGEGAVLAGLKGTDWQSWEIKVFRDAKLRFPLYYFPNWTVWVNGNETEINTDNDLGLITIDMKPGVHEVYLKLKDTPIRKTGNYLTLLAISAIPVYIYKQKDKK